MSRIARRTAVSPKVYRHFAIVTLAITACVGLFANGEGAEALEGKVDGRLKRNALLTAEAQKLGARHLKAGNLHLPNERRSYLAFAPDENSDVRDFDGAVDVSRLEMSNMVRQSGFEAESDPAPTTIPGLQTGDQAGSLPVVRRQPQQTRQSGPTAEQIEALLAASKARSGNNSED